MKRIALVAFALVLAPLMGAAQDAPPPGGPPPDAAGPTGTPDPQRLADMERVRAQMTHLHTQTRTQMLAALTPQHRAALATLIGQAAISNAPDEAAVAQRIDGILSRPEAQNVISLAASERVNARNVMEAARAQFAATLSPAEQAKMKDREAQDAAHRSERPAFTPDAGRELLRTMLGFADGGPRGTDGTHGFGPGGPPGAPHQ